MLFNSQLAIIILKFIHAWRTIVWLKRLQLHLHSSHKSSIHSLKIIGPLKYRSFENANA